MGESTVAIREARERNGVKALVNQAVAGSVTLATAVLGKRHRVSAALLTLSADGSLKFAGSVSGDLTGPMDIAAKGGFAFSGIGDLVETAPSEDLQLISTGGAARGVVKIVTE